MSGDKKSGKIYPHIWKYGPDPFKHEIHENFLKAKAQAMFRKEGWDFEFEEFYDLWKDDWHNRGRAAENVCLTRQDWDLPWSKTNCYIISRKEHLIQQGHRRASQNMTYKPRKQKTSPKNRYFKMRIDV